MWFCICLENLHYRFSENTVTNMGVRYMYMYSQGKRNYRYIIYTYIHVLPNKHRVSNDHGLSLA